MSALKRTSSTRLASRQSPYDASVTLFELPEPGPSTPRRSKRVKLDATQMDVPDLEDSVVLESTVTTTEVRKTPDKKRANGSVSPKKPKPIPQSLEVPHPAPPRWKEAYNHIKEMRAKIIAPVDTMGCDQAQFKETDPKNQRLSTLISLMLSSQTKDEVTDAAVKKLRDALGGTISIEGILAAEEWTISDAIAKVGFWRRKTQYIKQSAHKLKEEFESDVPKTVDELCSLPGVGPKMAFLALQVAWNINVGIGVDVHVHRITNRLGWHKPATKNPEGTRLNLQSWLPKELHPEINHQLVGFGQTICLPVGPKCDQCTLSTKGLCPSAQKVVKSKTKKTTKVQTSSATVEVSIENEEHV